MDVGNFLSEPNRRWHRQPGASGEALRRLAATAPISLPSTLIDLLRCSNGGEGPVALPPLVFCLHDVDFIVDCFLDATTRELYPGLVFFGSNGGLERLALDTRGGNPPWPVVMIDPVAGSESAVTIARDFGEFLAAVG